VDRAKALNRARAPERTAVKVTDLGGQILAELDRARRLLMALNDPQDRQNIERYIAELDARAADRRAEPASA
jgi:hypothetical protein